ncbi:conserved protein, unknown function [Plasmodium vinckei vinckei]|uniref:Homologous recombination OB-fold protein OB-fold domain-containing protein n=1 Tax=Plasmodium vinckei vinckei TaxID=54757 RepID=A0A449BV33_PLAVN|nr:conserved protein, unknown function [Plasmodium vinckei vinckei]KEG02716.1 hypothetical protein YYE_02548 [Plasmodium vinckei vinckei]VEV57288.1 conserved protein, unknown function [Plasmodium vinckei vinckei]
MLDENLSCLLDESDDDCIKKKKKKNELKNKPIFHSTKGSIQKSNRQNPASSILNFNIRNIGNLDSFFKNNNDENRNVSNNSSSINATDHFNYQNFPPNNSLVYSNINGEDDSNISTLGKGEANKTKNYEQVSKKWYKDNNLYEQKNAQLKNNNNNNSNKNVLNSEMHESVNNTNDTNKKETVHEIGNHCKLSKNKNDDNNNSIYNKEEDKLYMNTTRNISRNISRHETNLYKEQFLTKQVNNDEIFQRQEVYKTDDGTIETDICNWLDENNKSNNDIMKVNSNKESDEIVLRNSEIVKNGFSNSSYISEKNNGNNQNIDSLLSFETNKKSNSGSILNSIDSVDMVHLKKAGLQNSKNNMNELTNNIPSYISKEVPIMVENNLTDNDNDILSSNKYNKDYDRNRKLIYCYSFIKYNSWLKALKILNLPIDPFHLSINAHKYIRRNSNSNNNDSFLYTYNIHNILKNKHFSNYKVSKMIVLIKNIKCHSHGYFVICMDPSGQMPASLHQEIEKEYKKYIDVGSTLILKDVTVFETIDNLPYLIITLRSLVRVIKAEDTHYSVKDEIYDKICSLIK